MQQIFRTMEEYHMIEPGMRVVAGISGGADSVCLLHVLKEYSRQVPFELVAVHVEHGIRGDESLADAAFTEELCASLGIPCRVYHVPVQQIAQECGQSLEEAGRAQRYRIFEEVRKEWNADRIAIAHNQNDQAETVLWNLVRGSGLQGLGGIRPVRGNLIRPLLFTQRAEIEQLLTQAGIPWRTDATNLQEEYTRNRIRLSVLPTLERELNERAAEHIAQAAHRLQEVQGFLTRMTEQAAQHCIQCEGTDIVLLLEPFGKEDVLIRQELLRYVLSLCGGLKDIGSIHISMLEELTGMDCGKECHLPGRIRAVREAGVLRFEKKPDPEICVSQSWKKPDPETGALQCKKNSDQETDVPRFSEKMVSEVCLPVPGQLQIGSWSVKTEVFENRPELSSEILEEKKYTKWISCDTIKCNVCLRTRRSGDYLIVNTQGGRKKLKDYFIDCKIPKDKRDQIWLLADGSHILWVVGYRISEAAKVSPQTKLVMKIQMKEDINERES